MYDTVRGKVRSFWRKDLKESPPLGWEIKQGSYEDAEGKQVIRRTAVHTLSGMYIKGDDQLSHVMQVSLPRLYFGDNTELIKNQDELDIALNKMRLVQREVLEFDVIPRWTRLDLVWNFLGLINEFIVTLQNSKHPKVRSAVRVYQNESIQWGGRNTTIQVYDKLKEKGSKLYKANDRTIIRAEIRQKVNPQSTEKKSDPFLLLCESCLGGYVPTFEKGYKWYREMMILLSPKTIPHLASRSPLDFLAYLQANSLTDTQGLNLVDLYMANKSRSQKYRIMKELKSRILRHKFISFRQLLPEESAPVPIGKQDIKVA
jgi:hypothetical protein